MNHHPRPNLAKRYADDLLGISPLSDAPNGLFLAAARRTGKTEFLKQDLLPELQKRGLLVLYADLWESPKPPGELLADTLARAVRENLGGNAKFAKGAGLDKLSVPGVATVDLTKIGKPEGASLYEVLLALHQTTGKKIAFIIDEAQHALTTEEGDAAMRALKSARDNLRGTQGPNLLLVMSGSHRDKLMRLLNAPSAPFWGSQVETLPLLDDDFVLAQRIAVMALRPEFSTVRQSVLVEAFAQLGRRPQFFIRTLGELAKTANSGPALEQALLAHATTQRARERDEFSQTFARLEALQRAVLQRMLETSDGFRAYDAPALQFYSGKLGKKVGAAAVQRALEALRADEARLVWKSLRGEYAIYEQGLEEWYAYLVGTQAWPPKP